MTCGKMFDLQMPLVAVIVIFYLKFNPLETSPLFEHYIEEVTPEPGDVNTISESNALSDGNKNWFKTVVSEVMKSENIDESQKNSIKDYLKHTFKYDSDQSEDGVGLWQLFANGTISNDALLKDYKFKFPTDDVKSCMLDGLKEYMMSWAHINGSLRMHSRTEKKFRGGALMDASYRLETTDESLVAELLTHSRHYKNIVTFSAAYDGLTYAPFKTLSIMQDSLEHLMLKGNNFSSFRDDADVIRNEQNIAWATFPHLPALKELDISHCMIEFITSHAFRNMPSLKVLYLSHNKILRIKSDAFSDVPKLQYLDLSHMNSLDVLFNVPVMPMEKLINFIVSIKIEQHAFKDLNHLEYLDLSYTKVTRNSAVAFTSMGERLKYLSLCFSAFPMIGNTMFKNTVLRGLDLSGNFYAAFTITNDSFAVIADTLEFLFFEQSSLKDLTWLKKLKNLIILNLNSNNINLLTLDTFSNLKNLQLLDLSSNHIGNWYSRVFTHNPLKVLNIRDNNINILTSEMLMDFQNLYYLGIGDNNFLCDCVLRDLVDIASANNKDQNCLKNLFIDSQNIYMENSDFVDSLSYNGFVASIMKYVPMLTKSYANMKDLMQKHQIYNFHITKKAFQQVVTDLCPRSNQIVIYDKINGSTLKFQLLDYDDKHYWCFNETEKMNFYELKCESRALNDAIAKEIQYVTKRVVIGCCSVVLITLFGIVVYLKRWHIHYYYSSLKSASLLAVAAHESFEKFSDSSELDSNLMYDLFISYCQSDRHWVLEELMPNIENAGDMSICMHERDFQVGLTILDNIISCMDRSRCLLLVISSNFLLSHWCQFEMRLAQHRMFEASKEHLILVFLEDIPKRKRPKTLQYLMDVKTYIKWPAGDSPNAKWDERNIFWKRLRKSIRQISGYGSSRA